MSPHLIGSPKPSPSEERHAPGGSPVSKKQSPTNVFESADSQLLGQ